jgi:hypothetical protein
VEGFANTILVPTKLKLFEADHVFSSRSSPESDAAWESLITSQSYHFQSKACPRLTHPVFRSPMIRPRPQPRSISFRDGNSHKSGFGPLSRHRISPIALLGLYSAAYAFPLSSNGSSSQQAMIRNAYTSVLQHEQPKSMNEGLEATISKYFAHKLHISHCFDYIRQGPMCGGDRTLEWAAKPPPGEDAVHG